ncbi:MAG: metalloregulator ArsR/SmtB family transcription factor [Actinomycetota bacterium]|nr:metalloregulator ArsR/SmtB family transcription factor [Actinomycetota bacterium]MDP2287711.1 metalloregulator ArsR/SmtB family transcription factor [Actinomycetota bacterium]
MASRKTVDIALSSAPCCEPGLAAPLSRTEADSLAQLLKAVSDPTRLQLLSIIRSSPDNEACVCDLTEPVGLSQPTVSHHLKVLTDAGILQREQRGTWAWFSIDQSRLDAIAQAIS